MDLILLILAVVFAAPMVYGIYAGRQRARGVEMPPFGELLAAAWVHVGPVVEVVGYLLKRGLAHQWQPTEDEKPALFRRAVTVAYVEGNEGEIADEPDTPQTDQGVFALAEAIRSKQLDKMRAALIEAMVAEGWQTGGVRALLKGDTGAIGAEVEAAKQRLGMGGRTVKVNERVGGKPQTREVAL